MSKDGGGTFFAKTPSREPLGQRSTSSTPASANTSGGGEKRGGGALPTDSLKRLGYQRQHGGRGFVFPEYGPMANLEHQIHRCMQKPRFWNSCPLRLAIPLRQNLYLLRTQKIEGRADPILLYSPIRIETDNRDRVQGNCARGPKIDEIKNANCVRRPKVDFII